jgi:hypothetical protein
VDPDDAEKRNILLYYMTWTERNVDPVIVRHIVTRPTFDINYENGSYDALTWAARQKYPVNLYKTLIDNGADPKKKFESKNALESYVISNAKVLNKEVVKYFLKQEGIDYSGLSAEQLKLIQAEISEVEKEQKANKKMTEFLDSDSVHDKAKKMADEMVARMDTDKNGTLDFDEFVASYGKDIPAEMLEKQRVAFKSIDKNGDGILDADEVYDFCLITVKK